MKKLLNLLLVIFFCFVQVYSQQSGNSEEVVRVDTSLVVVPTKVTDRNNKNITNLKKNDFRLYEDGIEQQIASFADTDTPFTIALVLDVSNSTQNKLKVIKQAAIAFLDQLRPNDRVIIFTFDNHLTKVIEGTVDNLSNIQNSIAFSQTGGTTSIYDMIGSVTNDYLGKIGGKKAMIVFTDGIDTSSNHQTFSSSVRLAEESNILIYPIQYETVEDALKLKPKLIDLPIAATVQLITARGESLPSAYKRGTFYLRFLSNVSGGQYYLADTVENLSKSFAKIAKELSQLYGLSYYPQNQASNNKRRKIKVTVNMPKVIIQSRKTYILNSSEKK
ncbi:MAG: VWA domain-containing protein [Acidobacteriota bacterium]|nr:VWA domain-containing protein [Acidobacteriota bacterium]